MNIYKFERGEYFGSIQLIQPSEQKKKEEDDDQLAESCVLEIVRFDDEDAANLNVWRKIMKNEDLDGVILTKVSQISLAVQESFETSSSSQIDLSFREETNGNLVLAFSFPGLSILGTRSLEFSLEKGAPQEVDTIKRQIDFLLSQLEASKERELKSCAELETLNDKVRKIEHDLKESRETESKHEAGVDEMKEREARLDVHLEEMKWRVAGKWQELNEAKKDESTLREQLGRMNSKMKLEEATRSAGVPIDEGSSVPHPPPPPPETGEANPPGTGEVENRGKNEIRKQIEERQRELKTARSNFSVGMKNWNKQGSRRYLSLPTIHPDIAGSWNSVKAWQDKATSLEKEILSLREEYKYVALRGDIQV